MRAPLTPNALLAKRYRRAGFLRRGLNSLLYGALIGVGLTFAFHQNMWTSIVHSMTIALFCWFFIDVGRSTLARWKHRRAPPDSPEYGSHWPGWPGMLVTILIGTVLGFLLGNHVANWLTGTNSPGLANMRSLNEGFSMLLISLIPGLTLTYWFYSREIISDQEVEVQTAQRQAAENQLKLLESQLEPHMLFNTLANLRVLIGIDPPRAQAMLDQLIAFLRATLNASRSSSHPLAAEFSRLRDYLALMQMRMGERLTTRFELPDALAELPMPPLLLQPLVENAIKHGLEPKVEGGRIDVGAAVEHQADGPDMLVLSVRDTGVGLGASSADGTRFGLVQVRERLATLYGSAAQLTLEPAADDPHGGVLARIRIPIAALSATPMAAAPGARATQAAAPLRPAA